MTAGRYDIEVNQNSDFVLRVTFKDVNGDPVPIGGYSFKSQIKKGYGGDVVDEFVCAIVSSSAGIMQMSLTYAQTNGLDRTSYYYDLIGTITTPSTVTTRFMQGFLEVSPGVTELEEPET